MALFVRYVVRATRARDPHVIVMTRALPAGSRLVRQLLYTGHYAAPPKRYRVEDRSRPLSPSDTNTTNLNYLRLDSDSE